MIGIIKGILYMIFALVLAQFVNFLYNFISFYFRKKNSLKENVESNISLSMIQCEKCKTYIAKSDAYFSNGKFFCKKEHSD